MDKKRGIKERALAAAALAGNEKGLPIGPEAAALAEHHSSAELKSMSESEAAVEARAGKSAERR